MNENHKELISIALTVFIVAGTVYIIHRFIPSLVWASIITIATYPIYERFNKSFGRYQSLAALTFTTILGIILFIPLTWLAKVIITESQYLIGYLQDINKSGGSPPEILNSLPVFGDELKSYWENSLGQAGGVKEFLSNIQLSLTPASYYLKQIGLNVAHRSVQVGFTLLSLFFFFRDGHLLIAQVDNVGEYCLGKRWHRYARGLPKALQATVNGTVVVGLGVGILMGICYALVGFPAPTFTGFITAIAAMIPFVVPIVFAIVALVLFSKAAIISAIVVIAWGTLVMFVADHFVKPVLIGGAIKLPFLAVLFGILGGVETLGILGLFVGPIVMVLFVTLWQEPQHHTQH